MQIPERTRYIGDEDAVQIWWFVNGSLVDFSSGYTFVGKLAVQTDPSTLIFTKSSGFTGAVGSGTEHSGTPNLTVTWATSGEMNSVTTAGRYIFEVKATKSSDSSESTYQMFFDLRSRLG